MFGTVRNCLNMAMVNGYVMAAGIVAEFRGTMSGCINKGSISATDQFAGGICGVINVAGDNVIETIVENCYNTGRVTVNGGWTAGGISGAIQMYKDGDGRRCLVKNCYNLGEVSSNTGKSGQEGRLGGIVGFISDANEVRNCYNLGIVKQTGWAANVGGIVGSCYDSTKVSECYNVANVESQYYSVGGLCGSLNSTTCNFQDCYISKEAIVRHKGKEITAEVGTKTSNGDVSFGRLLGRSVSKSCYSNLGQKEAEEMPTVYDVLNEFGETDSEIWDKTEPNAPKLLWESGK